VAKSAAPPPVPALEFLERVRRGPPPRAVVLAGEESFLASEGVDAVRRALFPEGDPGGAVVDLDASLPDESDRAAAAIDELRTASLFGGGKLVVVRNPEAIGKERRAAAAEPSADDGGEGDDEPEEATAEKPARAGGPRQPSPITELVKQAASAPEGSTLVLVTQKPVKGKGSVSAEAITRAGAVLVDCRRLYDTLPPWSRGGSPADTEVARWAVRRAKEAHGKRLGPDAAALLVERLGSNLSAAAQALETLAAYVGAKEAIGAPDVALLVGESRDEPAWAFADAVLDRDLGRALGFLDHAFSQGFEDMRGRSVVRPEAIFPMLSATLHSAYRRLLLASEALARREDVASVPALASLPGFVLERVVRQASTRDPEDLLARHAAFVEAEAGVRGGGVPPRIALERLVVALAG
jgi:DNA polymerase-3 subunit delta